LVDALSHGQAMLFTDLSDAHLIAAARNDDHLRIMRELGFASAMIVPLRTRGRLLGAITFVCAESGRHYRKEDLALAEELTHRASLAIDNARLYREANEVQDELRTANEAKDEFLGLVSHELRTPITTIYGGARVLRSRGEQLDQQSKAAIVEDIERETERLHRIVEDLLVLARLEFGQEIAREPVLLQRVLEKCARNFGQRNPARPLELRMASELGPVAGEANYLEQVMRNLLNNAEKYSPQGSPIEIRAEVVGDEAVVSVRDRGPGIAPEEAESIFERFYRAEKTSATSKGLGLGLTVCKRLIEAQGGRTWARPRKGGGLDIGFTLPLYSEEETA
jgi:K+-sensing histidine kinase KdpD